jgi:ABC-type Na+ transport system ATPase subunit NatA
MKRYIVRGCEDAVTEALNEHDLACILGIPGIGKTTTARYIALKLREQGIIPIILTSADTDITLKDKLVEFADERGEKHTVLQIPIAKYHIIDKDLAKSIAEAIAAVVNTTLKDKILKKVSGITEKSEMVKKFADVVKGVGKKLDIPKEIVENAKNTLKEVSNFVDIEEVVKYGAEFCSCFLLGEEVVKYGAEFCSCFLLGVDIVKLAEKLKGKGGELKLESKVAVIIDDVAGLNLSEKVALLTLVDWLRKNDAEVLLVRRINLEKEFIEISTEISDSYVGYANELFASSRDARGFFEDKRQAVFMTTPDFDEVCLRLQF